jgi:hypothetical protein
VFNVVFDDAVRQAFRRTRHGNHKKQLPSFLHSELRDTNLGQTRKR